MQWRGLIRFLKEEVIGSENTFLAWALLAAMAGIVGTGFYLNSPDASFHGIAGSRELNVNFEYPVEIRSVHVLPGQKVHKGDLLVELDQSELDTQIRQLGAEAAKLKAEKSVRDQMNQVVGNESESLRADPLELEIKQLEDERTHLERQRDNLYVFAEIDGIVGSVNFKRGEKAPAFSPIVTVSPDSPTFVQGFVHELQQTSVKPGTEVEIHSLTNPSATVMGKVMSVGSRYVEIPVRLAPSPLKADSSGIWGREVTVEIPPGSRILLGEKVQISPYHPLLQSFVARAEEENIEAAGKTRPVRVPPSLSDSTNFEASGAAYLKDLDKYLVVSDDTDNRDSPWIFLMGEDGEVEERPLVIPGISAMKDMESIAAEGDYIYVMSSLTAKHKGGLDPDRNLLVRFQREGRKLTAGQSVPFGALLRRMISESKHPILKGLMSEGLEKLELESMSVREGALYLGLKAPSYPGAKSTVILRLPDVNALFAGKGAEEELEVWKTLRLDLDDFPTQRLTDITFVGTNLYFTTACKGENCGAVWKIGENESSPHLIQTHKHHSPEGIAYNAEKNLFLVTFDMGNNGSEFTTIAGPRTKGN